MSDYMIVTLKRVSVLSLSKWAVQVAPDANTAVVATISEASNQITVFGIKAGSDEAATLDKYIPNAQLDYVKEQKLEAIVGKTKSLIDKGFLYNNKLFPLLLDNRSNYIGIQAFSVFPCKVQTIDQDDFVALNKDRFAAFIQIGLDRFQYIKDGESDLIRRIRIASDIESVELIQDDRA